MSKLKKTYKAVSGATAALMFVSSAVVPNVVVAQESSSFVEVVNGVEKDGKIVVGNGTKISVKEGYTATNIEDFNEYKLKWEEDKTSEFKGTNLGKDLSGLVGKTVVVFKNDLIELKNQQYQIVANEVSANISIPDDENQIAKGGKIYTKGEKIKGTLNITSSENIFNGRNLIEIRDSRNGSKAQARDSESTLNFDIPREVNGKSSNFKLEVLINNEVKSTFNVDGIYKSGVETPKIKGNEDNLDIEIGKITNTLMNKGYKVSAVPKDKDTQDLVLKEGYLTPKGELAYSKVFAYNPEEGVKTSLNIKEVLKDKSGYYNVYVSTGDEFGESKYTMLEVGINRENPVISGTINEFGNVVDGKRYTPKEPELVYSASDDTKVEKLELYEVPENGGKRRLVSKLEANGGTIKLKANKKGFVYELQATDDMGKSSTKKLPVVESFVLDKEDPVIDKVDNTTVNNYYKTGKEYTFKVTSSDKNLDTSKEEFKVNGKVIKVAEDGRYHVTPDKESMEIEITVYDKAGNSAKNTYNFKEDKEAPAIKPEPQDDLSIQGGVLYISKPIKFRLVAEDSKAGVKGFLINGVFKANNSTIKLDKSMDKLPEVSVVDNLGNAIKVDYWKLISTQPFSRVVYTSRKPVILFDDLKPVNGWLKDVKSINVMQKSGTGAAYLMIDGVSNLPKILKDGEKYNLPLKEGVNKFKVKVTDLTLFNSTEEEFTFRVDNSAPKIDGVEFEGSLEFSGDKAYAKDKLKLKVNASDNESGIKSIKLFNGDKEIKGRNGVFTINQNSNSYTVKVEDKVGHTTTKPLTEFLSQKGIKSFVFDNDAPRIETKIEKPTVEHEGVKYYGKEVLIDSKVTNEEGTLKSFKLFINDKEVHDLSKGNYTIKEDGIYNVRIEAEDYSGNKSEERYSFTIDKTAPVFDKAEILSKVENTKNGVFSKDSVNVGLNAKDETTFIKGYYVNGVFQKDPLLTLKDGSYKVVVEDIVGNKSKEVELKDLTGWLSNEIIVDNEVPEIKAESYKGKWFNSEVSHKLSLSDNKGIQSYEVTLNGKEVIKKSFKELKTSVNEVINSSSVEMPSNGRFDLNVKVTDWSGNVSEFSDFYFIDNIKPKVVNFEFVADGNLEGNKTNGVDKYGFYFKDGGVLRIHCVDEGASSGLDYVVANIGDKEVKAGIRDGIAEVNIPQNFKGFVKAKAYDKVSNESDSNAPDGIITETSNFSISNNYLDLILPETNRKDVNGLPLYRNDITVGVVGRNLFAGLRDLIVNNVKESYDNNGQSNGALNGSVERRDKNLITSVKGRYGLSGNTNGISIASELIDRVGNSKSLSKKVSIDKDAPVVGISYSTTKLNGVYNTNRVATISVKERNFNPNLISISGKGGRLSEWSNNGGTWIAQMTFDRDGDYQFSVDVEDLAGNKAKTVTSDKFTIDKTAPVLSVNFDNNSVRNSKYYNKGRTATIRVVEHNFDASLFKVEGGSVSGWSHNGDTHTASVVFNKDGKYSLKVRGQDKGGNASNTYSSGEFIIDVTKPKLDISGIKNGASYFKNFGFKVGYSDTNLDKAKTSVSLVGREHGKINIGSLDGLIEYFNSDKTSKSDDIYTLKAKIVDLAGNISEETIRFAVNRGGSKFTFLNKDYNGKYLNKIGDVVITETTVEEIDESSITIILGDKTIKVPNDKIKIKKSGGVNSKWVYTYTIDKSLFAEDGTYRVKLFTKTKSGKENSSVAQEYVFVVDRTKPKLIVGGIESGKSYKEASKLLTINIDDLSGVDKLKVFVNDKEVNVYWENGVAYAKIEESSEELNIRIEAVDKAGNKVSKTLTGVFINSSWWNQFVRTVLFKVVVGGVLALVSFLMVLLFKRRKKEEEEDKDLRNIVTGTSSTGSSDTDETVSFEDKE